MFTLETQGTNTFLVYTTKEQDTFDTVTLGMLKNNEIDGLLPFTYLQMDSDIYFKYNVTSKIPLERFLMETVHKKQVLEIWRQIIDILLLMEDYMILDRNIVLDMENIYINVSSLKVEVVCLPVMGKENDLEGFFKSFIYKTHFSQNEDTSYVVRLIEYFNGTNAFSVMGLKELIKSLDESVFQKAKANLEPPKPMKQNINVTPITSLNNSESPIVPVPRTEIPQPPGLNPGFESSYVPPLSVPPSKPEKKGLFSGKKDKKVKPEKKAKLSKPAKQPSENVAPSSSLNFAVPGQQPSVPLAFGTEQNIPQAQSVVLQPVTPVPVKQNSYTSVGGMNFGETTVLNAEMGETTVLSSDLLETQVSSSKYLIRSRNQQKILINKDVFKIGKEASYVDYCISDNSNISRSHADIIVSGTQIFICDNNSTNHTYVNDMMLLPGEKKEVHSDDKIRLANEEFILKIF